MITTHTFLDRCATIIDGSHANTSLSPLMELCYGAIHTRVLIHFDLAKIRQRLKDKTYPDASRLRHVLRLYNTAMINPREVNWKYPDPACLGQRERAVSFDLYLYEITQEWDDGRGFDFAPNIGGQNRAFQTDGANWYFRRTDIPWDYDGCISEKSTIIATKRFEYGNEQPEIDITDYVNRLLINDESSTSTSSSSTSSSDPEKPNYGICIAFAPHLEEIEDCMTQYVAFFSNHTNQIFAPYIETTYDEVIEDDRTRFYNGKENKLYFYSARGGQSVNLDSIPTCTINGKRYDVTQASKGIYYATIPASEEFDDDTMYYDVWEYSYKGKKGSTEMYFTTMPAERYFSFGLPYETEKHPKFYPELHGIRHKERIQQGEVRKVSIECRIEYTSNQMFAVDNIEYRVYFVSGDREFDVYSWRKADRPYNSNSFLIDTSEMLPSEYFIDIRTTYDDEVILTRKGLSFEIVKDITRQKA